MHAITSIRHVLYSTTFATIVFILITNVACGQDVAPKSKLSAGIRPLSIVMGGFEPILDWSQRNNKLNRLALGYFSLSPPRGLYGDEVTRLRGYRIEVQFRKFTDENKNTHIGFYYFPYATVRRMNIWQQEAGNREVKYDAMMVGGGLGAGYAFPIHGKVSFDLWLATGYVLPVEADEEDLVHLPLVNPYQQGVQIRGGMAIVYQLK
jgi:hypothetical protein